MHEDQAGALHFQRAPGDLARVNRRMVDGAASHDLVEDQLVLPVEEDHAELLARLVLDFAADVFDQRAPGGDDLAGFQFLERGARVQLVDGLEIGGDRLADAVDLDQHLGRRREDGGQAAKLTLQRLGNRLHIPARDEGHQQHFEDFVIVQRLGPARQQLGAQPLPVALPVGSFLGHAGKADLCRRFSSFNTSDRS